MSRIPALRYRRRAAGLLGGQLQRGVMENFIGMVQALGDTDEFHSAGIGPVSRPRVVMLLGGLRELTAITVEDGGRMSDITDEAVAASVALLLPETWCRSPRTCLRAVPRALLLRTEGGVRGQRRGFGTRGVRAAAMHRDGHRDTVAPRR